MIAEAELTTAGNTGLLLSVAFNYGSRNEIVRAVRRLAAEVAAGRLDPAAVDEAQLAGRLDTAGLPDPDLIIRTSGEQRLSNFLLWQGAYAELVFTATRWPDFSARELDGAIAEFRRRSGPLRRGPQGGLDRADHLGPHPRPLRARGRLGGRPRVRRRRRVRHGDRPVRVAQRHPEPPGLLGRCRDPGRRRRRRARTSA
jgi:hypothetical protein